MRCLLLLALIGLYMTSNARVVRGAGDAPGPGFPTETYRQEVRVELGDTNALAEAQVVAAPLHAGKAWALASRWDDNQPRAGQLRMAQTLAKHGYHATWYRNRETDLDEARKHLAEVLKEGNSVGGHSLTHPWLPYQSRTRIFEEIAAVRAHLEALTDSPVNSFALPFLASTSVEGAAIHRDITTCMARAGYFHLPSRWFNNRIPSAMLVLPYLPPDGGDVDDYARKALEDPGFAEKHRGFAFSMHVWYRSDEQWSRFEDQLERYGGRKDWWYCNQNQYAAYRWQWAHTRIEDVRLEGHILRMVVVRHLPVDLNDEIPLTLEVRGVPSGQIKGVRCETAACEGVASNDGVFRFDLHHDRDRSLPMRIGHISNPDNRAEPGQKDVDADFPDLRSLLHFDGKKLHLSLENASEVPLQDVRVTYRLGPGWEGGAIRRPLGDTASGDRLQDALEPARETEDHLYFAGISYFVAQVDFRVGSEAGRLHVDCRVDLGSEDPSYPQGRFLRAGPIAPDAMDLEALATAHRAGSITRASFPQADGDALPWVRDEGPLPAPFLGAEILRTTGKWNARDLADCRYLLASTIHSAEDREVLVFADKNALAGILLNGELLPGREGSLRKGENSLVLVYRSPRGSWHGERAGCFFRLVDPDTRKRLTDIRYDPR
jgi:peptidoglycan/xylan/chitin deacetylase (PgdA/CDA1 family)